MQVLTLYILGSSADILCKQFGSGSDLRKRWSWHDALMIFLKDFFQMLYEAKKHAQPTGDGASFSYVIIGKTY